MQEFDKYTKSFMLNNMLRQSKMISDANNDALEAKIAAYIALSTSIVSIVLSAIPYLQ